MSTGRGASQVQSLQLARQFLQSGEAGKAEALYRDFLKRQPKNVEALYLMGVLQAQQGKSDSAATYFGKAAHLKPDFVEAHYNNGVMLNALGRHAAALGCYDKVLGLKPDHDGALLNRAGSLFELRRFAEALEGYDRVLVKKPDHVDALDSRGTVLREFGRIEEALASHERALAAAPRHAGAWNNRGIALRALGRLEDALESYDSATEIEPGFADAFHNRGVALLDRKRFEEALASCRRATELAPGNPDAWQNYGVALLELARFEEAVEAFHRVFALQPDHEAHSNCALALMGLKRHAEALDHLDRAFRMRPDFAKAHNNRGLLLNELGRFEEAIESFDRAIALKPDYAEPWFNRGIPLVELKRFEEAIESYDRVIAIAPDYEYIYGMRLNAKMCGCDWSDLGREISLICDKVSKGERASHPFFLLAATDAPILQRRATEIWQLDKHPPSPRLSQVETSPRSGKIRLGYFSADFHMHPVAYLLAGMLERHDRSKFELTAFSLDTEKADDMRERLQAYFDEFIDVTGLSDAEVASLAHARKIDIAIDLQGFTKGSRPGVFAIRVAPLQVNFLGYPGTMGADYIDYMIADLKVAPHQSYYKEKMIYLPDTFLPTDRTRIIAEKTPTRAEAGLPDDGFVFCCFNNSRKILPEIFDIWMRLLQRVDGSVLWLFKDNASAAENLRKEASARGVDPDRLIFAKFVTHPADHLARLRCADLFLDTLPYNAHATASDALWVGLPVLTRIGDAFAGRVAASLLEAVGLSELVTTTAQEYETLALALAGDPVALAQIRRKLADNRLIKPLFDSMRFTRHIEAAYTEIYKCYQAGLPPDHIHICGKPRENIAVG